MTIDSAETYARQFAPLFVSGDIDTVGGGKATLIPAASRPSIKAHVSGGRDASGDDVRALVYRCSSNFACAPVDVPMQSMPEN